MLSGASGRSPAASRTASAPRASAVRLLQTLADGIKLLVKEDLTPAGADRFLFRLAPYIAFCASFVGFLALPFGNGLVGYQI